MHRAIQLVFLALTALLSQQPAYAEDLENQRKALQLIRETAADICSTVAREGTTQSAELSGQVKAKLGGVVAKVADLGIEGAGRYTSDEYKNVLQKDLAGVIQNNTNCRLDVFKMLQEKMIGTKAGSSARPAAETRLANTAPDARGEFQHDSVKILGRYVRYTKWLDGTQSCWNGANCGTASFILENLGAMPFKAAIKAGSTSIGPCIGRETEAAGLRLYNNNPGWSNNVSFDTAQVLVSPRAKLPVTIKLENCSATNSRVVDVSATLTISVEGKVVDLPVYAADVPVQ